MVIAVGAFLTVVSSITLLAMSAQTMIGTLPRSLYPWMHNFTVFMIACLALAKPAIAVVIAQQRSTSGLYVFWLLILVVNWFAITIVWVPWVDGVNATNLWLSGSILMLEISSGYVPALMYRLCSSKSYDAVHTDQPHGPVGDCPTPTAPQLVPLACEPPEIKERTVHRRAKGRNFGFTTIRDLLLHARDHPEDFPKFRFDSAGNMMASFRPIARALGVSSTSTVSDRLQREKAAGLINFETFATHTRISLAGEKAPSQKVSDGAVRGLRAATTSEHGDLNFENPLIRIKNAQD